MIEAFILVCVIGGLISPDYQSFGFDDLQRPLSFQSDRFLGTPKTHCTETVWKSSSYFLQPVVEDAHPRCSKTHRSNDL
jgi:hypothetical protein